MCSSSVILPFDTFLQYPVFLSSSSCSYLSSPRQDALLWSASSQPVQDKHACLGYCDSSSPPQITCSSIRVFSYFASYLLLSQSETSLQQRTSFNLPCHLYPSSPPCQNIHLFSGVCSQRNALLGLSARLAGVILLSAVHFYCT